MQLSFKAAAKHRSPFSAAKLLQPLCLLDSSSAIHPKEHLRPWWEDPILLDRLLSRRHASMLPYHPCPLLSHRFNTAYIDVDIWIDPSSTPPKFFSRSFPKTSLMQFASVRFFVAPFQVDSVNQLAICPAQQTTN